MRGRILSTTVEALLADPAGTSLTIASLCRSADCSPPTLYYYWPNQRDLLSDAAGVVWQQFRSAVAPQDDAAETRLRSRGHAYLDFALKHENAFRLLFLPPAGSTTRAAANATTPGAGLHDLIDDVTAITSRRAEPADARALAMILWAFVHGVACLWLGRDGLNAGDAHALLDAGMAPLLAELATA